ncbi:MAG: hypothetical protein M0O96_01955 [Desulforhopalus sp.]|nr:hypothetical protein [Desulforhopalus sp.]
MKQTKHRTSEHHSPPHHRTIKQDSALQAVNEGALFLRDVQEENEFAPVQKSKRSNWGFKLPGGDKE